MVPLNSETKKVEKAGVKIKVREGFLDKYEEAHKRYMERKQHRKEEKIITKTDQEEINKYFDNFKNKKR
eukprot:UN00100